MHAGEFLDFCFRSYEEWALGPWAMLLKPERTIVGNCSFCRVAYERTGDALERFGEVNYYVAPVHRGQGFATEALVAMLNFGFTELALTRIQGRCQLDNLASERVLQKAGMKFERLISREKSDALQDKLHAIRRDELLRVR